MADPAPPSRYRFGVFEADASTGELRKQGIRIRLNAQPFQLLLMLLDRPGEVLTREEIAQALWSDGTFVDYEHGLNSAVNRIREALGDSASNPRFIETLARRGYRFVAPVQRIAGNGSSHMEDQSAAPGEGNAPATGEEQAHEAILPTSAELPDAPHNLVRLLFLLFQLMYIGFYIGALANLPEIEDLLSAFARASSAIFYVLTGSAAILIAVRAYLLSAVALRAPGMRERFLKIWLWLLAADVLWALSPLLLLHHINTGVAIACIALLVYSPFAQRSLVLMGAVRADNAQRTPPA